ncbi:hypothetical protein D3C72_2415320 [compost metagenome]
MHRVAQFRQDEAPVQCGEALVGIDRQHSETAHAGGAFDQSVRLTRVLTVSTVKRRHVSSHRIVFELPLFVDDRRAIKKVSMGLRTV